MFRKTFFVILMSMLLAGAVASGSSLPAILLMGSLALIAFFILVAGNQPEE